MNFAERCACFQMDDPPLVWLPELPLFARRPPICEKSGYPAQHVHGISVHFLKPGTYYFVPLFLHLQIIEFIRHGHLSGKA